MDVIVEDAELDNSVELESVSIKEVEVLTGGTL